MAEKGQMPMRLRHRKIHPRGSHKIWQDRKLRMPPERTLVKSKADSRLLLKEKRQVCGMEGLVINAAKVSGQKKPGLSSLRRQGHYGLRPMAEIIRRFSRRHGNEANPKTHHRA
jgi:hypothetical protein